jgi:peptide/nickel transport system ATP-binding protein
MGLIGESGSGKSLLAAAILGLLPENARVSGQVLFRGQDISRLTEREWQAVRGTGIALLHQNPELALDPIMSLGRQLIETGVFHGEKAPQLRTRASAILVRLGFSEPQALLRSYPHRLSGGMNQRILIAQAMLARPDLLIADEPSTGLDADNKEIVLEELLLLRESSHTEIFVISHDLPFIRRVTQRYAVLYGGEILEEGDTETLTTSPQHPYLKALLAALPEGGFTPIRGPPYSAVSPISGCVFAPRCSEAIVDCASVQPPAIIRNNRMVKCLRYA